MSGFSNTAENKILGLIFLATAWTGIADNTATSPDTNISMAAHSADPGDAGTQSTSEIAYTSYARVNVSRSGTGWSTPSGGSVSPAAAIQFPNGTGGSGTITHASAGRPGGGASDIHMVATVTPNIVCGSGVRPELTTASTFTVD